MNYSNNLHFREVMVMENTNPMVGTCGTISWQLVEINMRLIIMWSVPFNFNIRDSYYAIGLTHNKVTDLFTCWSATMAMDALFFSEILREEHS